MRFTGGRVGSWLALLSALACAPAPPPPVPRTYQFDGDVLAHLSEDQDYDGRPDAWFSFRRGDLIKFEHDRDRDGKPDWRETWPPAPEPWREFQIQEIDGRWRLIPINVLKRIHGGGSVYPRRYDGRAEKLIDGRWKSTFEDVEDVTREFEHVRARHVTRQKHTWSFHDGKPVEVVVTGDGPYQRITWQNGLPLLWEYGAAKDKLTSISHFRDGESTSRVNYDETGTPTFRYVGASSDTRYEVFRDGRWVGDFEDEQRDAQGRLYGRRSYRDGRETLHDTLDPATGVALRRSRHEKDGSWVEESLDRATGDVVRKAFHPPGGWPERVEVLVNGKWTGDFTDESSPSYRMTYRGGRLARVEYGGTMDDEGRRVGVFFADGREDWGDGKVTRYALTYAEEPGRVRRLLRELRDLDGDGTTDLNVDYERLTVEQPAKRP